MKVYFSPNRYRLRGGGTKTLKPRYEKSSLTHGPISAWASSLARPAWASDPETSQARVANFVSPQIVLLKTFYESLFESESLSAMGGGGGQKNTKEMFEI